MSRTLLSLVAVSSLILSAEAPSFAQSDLDRILERDKIAAQKLQSEVNQAITQSRTLQKTDADGAAETLQTALTKVRNATELSADDRVRLVQRLQGRLREVTVVAQSQSKAADETARQAAQKEARSAATAGAAKTPAPNEGPASIAAKAIESRNAALSSVDKNKFDRTSKNQDVLTNIQRGATGMTESMEFPKDWARIAERGKPKLSTKEVALLKALNSSLSVDFTKAKLSQVIDFLQEKAGLTILLDEQSLKDAMVDLYEESVTFKVNKVTVRTILRKALADRGLAYVIKEGMIQVVTQEKARQMMVVRAYPVNDLVAADNPLFWGPIFSRAIMLQNAQKVIDMIQMSVEPSQWTTGGGPGTITFHEGTMSLIIRASAEMHYQLGGGISTR